MPNQSDIEQEYKDTLNLPCPIDDYLEIFMPKLAVFPKPSNASNQQTNDTFAFTSRIQRDSIQNGIEICLNDKERLSSITMLCELGKIKASFECDFQIALDKQLFRKENIGNRRIWTTESARMATSDHLVNFYSSRIAHHTNSVIHSSNYEFSVPHSVSQGLYFDFECPTATTDHEGRSIPLSGRSAAEWNLRALNIYGRVFVRYMIHGYSVVLRSDLHKLSNATLLGAFSIREKVPRLSEEAREFNGMQFSPEGIIIHVFVGQGFNESGPVFDGGKSSHYVVGDKGSIWKYVNEDKKASHAAYVTKNTNVAWRTYIKNGKYLPGGSWQWNNGITDANPNYDTIGIEHEGLENTPWPLKKYCATGWLIQDIYSRWNKIELNNSRIIPHHEVNDGKTCPGTVADLGLLIRIANGYCTRKRSSDDTPIYQ